MKSKVLKTAYFLAVAGVIAVFSFNNASAQTDPAGICPDGSKRCAESKDGTKKWHKGNADTIEVAIQ